MNFFTGLILGTLIGFFTGFLVSSHMQKKSLQPEVVLAWVLTTLWIMWHIGAGLGIGKLTPPPSLFDIIAGGSVGFILGEKFFEYIGKAVGNIFRK